MLGGSGESEQSDRSEVDVGEGEDIEEKVETVVVVWLLGS